MKSFEEIAIKLSAFVLMAVVLMLFSLLSFYIYKEIKTDFKTKQELMNENMKLQLRLRE